MIGAGGIETGLLNIMYGGTNGVSYDAYSTEQKIAAQNLMDEAGIGSHYENDHKMGIENRKWDETAVKPLDMDYAMDIAGGSIAAQVFARYYDSTADGQIAVLSGKDIGDVTLRRVTDSAKDRYSTLYNAKSDFYNSAKSFVDDSFEVTGILGEKFQNKDGTFAYKNYDYKHFGFDLGNGKIGNTILAGLSGKILYSYSWDMKDNTNGNWMTMEYGYQFEGSFVGSGIYGEYLHMQNKPVATGFIPSNMPIGTVGGSGKDALETYGPHLHYTIYTNNNYFSDSTARMLMGQYYSQDVVERLAQYGKKTTYDPQNLYFIDYKERKK